jgi:hypothetical protein
MDYLYPPFLPTLHPEQSGMADMRRMQFAADVELSA